MRPRALFLLSYAVVAVGCHVNGCWNNDFDSSPCTDCSRSDPVFDSGSSFVPDAAKDPQGELIATLAGEPHGLAVVEGSLYVIDGDDIVLFPRDVWNRVPIAMNIGPATGLVASADTLYWSTFDNAKGEIMRLRVRPQIGIPERVAMTTLPIVEGIAVDDGVRWLEPSGLFLSDDDGGSILVAAATVKPTKVFSPIARRDGRTQFIAVDRLITQDDEGGVTSIDLEGARAVVTTPSVTYVARSIDGGVEVGEIRNGSFVTIDTQDSIRSFVFDGVNSSFLTEPSGHTVRRVGGRIVAKTKGEPRDLAFLWGGGGGFLYFTTKNPNEIQRVAY